MKSLECQVEGLPFSEGRGSPGWDSKGQTVTERGSRDCPALPTDLQALPDPWTGER